MDDDPVILTDGPMIEADRLESELGWTLKPEGLCRADTCVIVPDRSAVERDGRIDVTAVAALLDRPVVVDQPSAMVAIGAPRRFRQGALSDLRAPDFVLPDLDGTSHALSDHRSKKRLLVAFSSW
ncbi:MAG: peroxiredoxin family protein [Acidimicrobiales bacterium]